MLRRPRDLLRSGLSSILLDCGHDLVGPFAEVAPISETLLFHTRSQSRAAVYRFVFPAAVLADKGFLAAAGPGRRIVAGAEDDELRRRTRGQSQRWKAARMLGAVAAAPRNVLSPSISSVVRSSE